MPNPVLRVHAAALQRAALAAVDPRAAVRRHVRRDGSRLRIVDRWYDLDAFDRVFVVGGGKATVPMLSAVADILGLVEAGYRIDEIPTHYPTVTLKTARQALRYAANILGKEEILTISA